MRFSKNTLKILKVFYAHPERQFYIQELGRLLKKKPGVFQRTLYSMEKEGVLRSHYQANARFFALNKNYQFYKEFRSMVGKIASIAVIAASAALLYPCLNSASGQERKAHELSSLREAIEIAFRNNKDIKVQEYALKVSDADILDARSAFLPKVDFNAGYTHNGTVFYNSNSGTKKDTRIFSGYKDENSAGVTLDENLYSGGANLAAFRQAQLGLKEQIETLRATKLNVEFETKRLYYGLLLAYETRRIAENLLQQAQGHYEQVAHNFRQGTSSRFDALQSKVQVSLLMPQLINAQNSIDLIIADLDKLLGLKVGDNIVVKDKLAYSPLEIKEEDFLKEAYLSDPEMVLKSLGIDISQWAIKYARAGWLPQVDVNAEYLYKSNNIGNMFNNKHSNWSAGLSVRLPIFDGFSTKAKVDAAKAKYMQAVIGKDNLADQVAVDIRQACLDLVEALSVIKSQEDNLQDAKEALEISYVRYNNGVGVNLDVLDAQVALANVEKNLAEGIYDYIMAKAKLERTMGRSFTEEAK